MAGGILGGLFGDSSSVMPGLLDQAGYMDPAEYDRRRTSEAMQGLWAGLLQGSGPSLEPRNFFSALGGGLAGSQKFGNEFDEAQLRRAQGIAAYQKSQLERERLRLGYQVTQQYLGDQGAATTPRPPGAPPAAPDAGGGGGGARAAASTTANADLPPEARSFLDTVSGPESGGAYNIRYTPKGGTTFEGYDQHPKIFEPGPQGPSSAAGRYQIVGTTWDGLQNKYGYPDFKPETQDTAAWQLAQDTYKRRTGGDLLTALQEGKLQDVQQVLKGEWPTLNMGSYGANLRKYAAGTGQLAEVPRYGADLERLPSENAIPGLIAAGAPGAGAAPAPGGTVTGPPAAVPSVTSVPGPTNGIDPRRGAALEQILSGQQTAQAGPPLRQLAQLAGPGAADAAASEAPAPGGITYGTGGMLGPLPPQAAAGAVVPGALPTLPERPALPTPPALAMPQPLPPPPAAPALRPLEATGAAPPVQLSPEQAARTRRAQGLALGLDLMGITVPKFIADEAGIEVAARSAQAQEAARQPFLAQLKQLEADTTAAQKRWDELTDQQKTTLAAQRNQTVKEMDAQYANIHERFKSELDLFTAGPKAKAIAEGQLDSELAKITGKTKAELEQNLDTPIRFEEKDAAGNITSVRYPTPRELRAEIAARGGRGIPTGFGPRATEVQTGMGKLQVEDVNKIQTAADTVRQTTRPAVNVLLNNPPIDWAGPLAGAKQEFNRLTTSILGVNAESVKSYEMAAQLMGDTLRQALRASDPNPTEKQSVNIQQTFPTPASSRAGYDQGLRYLAGIQDYQLYKNDELQRHLYSPDNPSHDPQGFRQKFQMSAIPFVVLRMQPPDQAAYLAKLARVDPQAVTRLANQMEQIRTTNPNWQD